MERMNDLRDLLQHELHDLHSAEAQLAEALPKMIGKSESKELKEALSGFYHATEARRDRLPQVEEHLDKDEEEEKKGFLASLFSGKGTTVCYGMRGIVREGNTLMRMLMPPEVLDAAILACAQKAAQYGIGSYRAARDHARALELAAAAKLLEQLLADAHEVNDRLMALSPDSDQKIKAGTAKGPGHAGAGSGQARRKKTPAADPTAKSTASTGTTGSKAVPPEHARPKASAVPRSTPGRSAAPSKKSSAPKGAASDGKTPAKASGTARRSNREAASDDKG